MPTLPEACAFEGIRARPLHVTAHNRQSQKRDGHVWIKSKRVSAARHTAPLYETPSSSSSASSSSSLPDYTTPQWKDRYAEARRVRIKHGVEAARPLYRSILLDQKQQQQQQRNDGGARTYGDLTTATRLAASQIAQHKLERVGYDITCNTFPSGGAPETMDAIKTLLLHHGYTRRGIASHLGVAAASRFRYARAPVYATPAAAGTRRDRWPWERGRSNDDDDGDRRAKNGGGASVTALDLLVSLFLVGLAVPKSLLVDTLLRQQEHRQPQQNSSNTKNSIDSLSELFLVECEYDPDLVYSVVSIMPIDLSSSLSTSSDVAEDLRSSQLLVATDWHPRVLSQTTIAKDRNEDAVMYIGPDSLALIQHWMLDPYSEAWNEQRSEETTTTVSASVPTWTMPLCYDLDRNSQSCYNVLDVCTGSGIQALAAVMILDRNIRQRLSSSETRHTAVHVVCVDVNPRALRFTRMNAILNGIDPECVTCIVGDLVKGTGRRYDFDESNQQSKAMSVTSDDSKQQSLVEILRDAIRSQSKHNEVSYYDMMTANPPFLPVPPELVDNRHGLFSDGGSTGEMILAGCVKVAGQLLSPDGGYLALVSEFFLERGSEQDDGDSILDKDIDQQSAGSLLERIQSWWSAFPSCASNTGQRFPANVRGLLFTNEIPIDARTYAERRSDSYDEYGMWLRHLQAQKIGYCSPGNLYLRKERTTATNDANTGEVPNDRVTRIRHIPVPKSNYGSIWTPSNPFAVKFTQNVCRQFFGIES